MLFQDSQEYFQDSFSNYHTDIDVLTLNATKSLNKNIFC